MEDLKRAEIKEKIEAKWDEMPDVGKMVLHIEHGYIFGEYANNEHYKGDDIRAIVLEVQADKAPAEPIAPVEV